MAPSNGVSKHTLEDSSLTLMEASVAIQSSRKAKFSTNGVGPGPSPGIGHKKDNLMKTTVEIGVNDDEVGPGHSPGIGHKESTERDNNNNNNNLKKSMATVQSVDNAKASVNGVGLSHSPGVGHKP
ncbi:hypothetical protein PIB30_060152 [Stylosanthes scabra]|uniref:Uncharacterized protein n=1 Tax=Stylosanthes scabra TaxID=79078 RepID=A0ABU6UKB5_9FABA|nr:hypothetical protein [Stylosanthes scabra]